jgi:Uma2 family endonuclease
MCDWVAGQSSFHRDKLGGAAPMDILFSEFDIVKPDLVPTTINVAPHFEVEILSPATAGNDRTIKKDLYERAGMREYWIVDPLEQQVDQWIPRDEK